jgi:hypothetical protein
MLREAAARTGRFSKFDDLRNQERIKGAFAAIQANGIEASLESCRGLAERINSGLCEINTEAFTDSSLLAEFQLALEDAAYAAIQANGIEAFLESCRGLAERINSGLCEINTEAFADSSSLAEFQLALEDAAYALGRQNEASSS